MTVVVTPPCYSGASCVCASADVCFSRICRVAAVIVLFLSARAAVWSLVEGAIIAGAVNLYVAGNAVRHV